MKLLLNKTHRFKQQSMKTQKLFFAFLATLLAGPFYAQPELTSTTENPVEGRILDSKTATPIAYANIYNKRTNKGTISNLDGYFRLSCERLSDTLVTDTVLCFVNLYFDLMELERQELEAEIWQSDQSIETIEQQ